MREMRGSVCWDMSSSCVPGGLPRPLGGYQPNVMMEAHSPAPAWHMHSSIVIKKEPNMEEDRNDSGITSGSEFHSSSPGSDNSQDYNPAYTSPPVSNNPTPYYNTPVTSQYNQPRVPTSYQSSTPFHLGFNPLTPPSSEPMASPKDAALKPDSSEQNTTLTPHASPTSPAEAKSPSSTDGGEDHDQENPLRRLQMSFEKGDYLPAGALSPKTTSEHSNDDDTKSDLGTEEGDEETLRVPKVNSHGKVKTFKCKQCDFVAITKLDFWEHSKGHIKTDKLLTCPKCPFVTEYKHHLEYHLRNHFGSKPFKCDKCSYSCVNKSMLNSHMKSHSNIYQYRCHDCSYATKYCHSLKLHLRKYGHKPAMVLNPDGTPNPLPIIDIYGTRRGPKMKLQQGKEENEAMQNPFAQLIMGAGSQLPMNFPYPFMRGFPGALGNPLFFPQLAQLARERNLQEQQQDFKEDKMEEDIMDDGALDLSKTETPAEAPTKNRRKGRAFKLDRSTINQQYHSDDEDIQQDATQAVPEKHTAAKHIKEVKEVESTNNNQNDFVCQFCCISFGDLVLYTMHMGYHGYKDPFTCNMCGEQCTDKVAFFLHIARNPHT